MLARSILSSYSRLLAGIALAGVAVALAGCDNTVAQKAEPPRPVLVATAHYEAETPERSFVGTIKPRIETDMGFRVPGKVAKRLVEVGRDVVRLDLHHRLRPVLRRHRQGHHQPDEQRDRGGADGHPPATVERFHHFTKRVCPLHHGPPLRRWSSHVTWRPTTLRSNCGADTSSRANLDAPTPMSVSVAMR